jgi:predicted DNA-binding transcriptional regulator YafY
MRRHGKYSAQAELADEVEAGVRVAEDDLNVLRAAYLDAEGAVTSMRE